MSWALNLDFSPADIGVVFNKYLSMTHHVDAICKSSFYQPKCIAKIGKFITPEFDKILIPALAISKLDHCNALLYGVNKKITTEVYSMY